MTHALIAWFGREGSERPAALEVERICGRGLLLFALACVSCRAATLTVLEPADQSKPADSGPQMPADAGALQCSSGIATDMACTRSGDCCSGYCALDSLATLTCRPTPGCLGLGRSCTHASQCCSLYCSANDSGQGTCSESGLCAVLDQTCQNNADCCSNLCTNGRCADPGPPACRVAGESCGTSADCCGQVCNTSLDEGNRCQLLPGCRVNGELCAGGADCCTGTCNADKMGVYRCAGLGPCTMADNKGCTRAVGEVCKNSDECCTRVCIATTDGISRCAPAPGCRPECDLCQTNTDCCSGLCQTDAMGTYRCAATEGCQPEGEVCDKDGDCCQTAKPTHCVEDPKGLKGKRCRLDVPAAECLGEKANCSLASRCCSGHCVPGSDPGFSCTTQCATEGQPCTSRSDCCMANADCIALQGQRACRESIH